MISKGLDFKKVSLVGVLAADMSLNLPDYQAIEHTFQLLTQVSGRAGRHDILGEVVIQTYNPDHYAIKYAKNHDYYSFYDTEISYREIAGYKPIKELCQIVLYHKSVNECLKQGTKLVFDLRKRLNQTTQVLGPVLPKIARINNIYRAQIIIKHDGDSSLQKTLQELYDLYSEQIEMSIDHNPQLL
jgi:primosomal protein N' (replication factor Y)